MKKLLLLLAVVFWFPINVFAEDVIPAVSPTLKQKFRFDGNGKFTVMQLSDIHAYRSLRPYPHVKRMIRKGIRKYRPALIIVTGDNIHEETRRDEFEKCVNQFVKIFLSEKVPFAITFGNHDYRIKSEEYFNRQEQYDLYRKLGGEYFVDFDIAQLSGVGNGAIPLYSSDKPVFNIIVMDSGDYVPGTISYDGCHTDQIRWYEEKAGTLPCLWFQHIITPDIYENGNFIDIRDFHEAEVQKFPPVETTKDDPDGFYCKHLKKYIKKVPENAVWNKYIKCYVVTDPKAVYVNEGQRYVICDEPGVLFWYWRKKCFIKLAANRSPEGWKGIPCSTPPWVYIDDQHTCEGRTLYQSWLKTGNLKGVYFGHDHVNYFDLTDDNGIRMGGCLAALGNDPGFRIFEISEDGSFTTQSVTASMLGIKKE